MSESAGRRLVIGCMTGTSLDGLDASLVEIAGRGLEMRASHVASVSRPLGPVGGALRELAEQRPMTAGDIAAVALDFAEVHADAVEELCAGAGVRQDLVCVQGQTVYHAPPLSWQLFQPAPLARRVGAPVVCDLRAADLAAGGQGAPITPIADWILLRDRPGKTAVVNLGGFANVTLLEGRGGPDGVAARDLCPCNQLLDRIARELLGVAFDDGGAAALASAPDEAASADLQRMIRPESSARSLGTGDEGFAWVKIWKTIVSPGVMAASACAAIGRTVGESVRGCERVLLAGGGVRNAALVRAIDEAAGVRSAAIDEVGVPAAYRESVAFGILGALCQDRVPITLPRVTGLEGPAPLAGLWALV